MDKTDDEPIITPAHLGEVLTMYRGIQQRDGDEATVPFLQAKYMVALVEYAIGENKRADELQSELDDIGRFDMSSLVHNGGASSI